MLSLAEQLIFERAKRPLFLAPDTLMGELRAKALNASCGDEIELYITTSKGKLTTVRHQSRGCAISTASADFLCELLTDYSVVEAKALSSDRLLELLAIKLSPARLKCALLPLEALKRGLGSSMLAPEAQD